MKSSKTRQILLGSTALVFAGIAAGSLATPRRMAEGLGYSLDSVDALSEFRAIYVGLWLATAVLMVVALRRVSEAVLGDLCAILVLGQTLGRVVSLLLDGMPTGRVWPMFVLEALGGLALLVVRPSEQKTLMAMLCRRFSLGLLSIASLLAAAQAHAEATCMPSECLEYSLPL